MKIKTFAQACKKLGISAARMPKFANYPARHRKAMIAHSKLIIIIEALNDGWKPNWKDNTEYKWHVVFDLSSGGLVFDGATGWSSGSYVGSRLCFRDRETAIYAAKTFKKLYEDYYLLN